MPESCDLERQAIENNRMAGIFAPEKASQTEIGELHRSEELLKFQGQILSQVSDAVVAIDIQGRIAYWNQGAERLYNVKVEDAIAQPLNTAFQYHWIAAEDEQAADESLATTGFWQGEMIHLKNSGEKIYVDSSVSVLTDSNGNAIGVLAVSHNITERKQIEAQLKKSEEKFRTCLDNMLDGFAIQSAIRNELGRIIDFQIDYVNAAAGKSNLLTPEEQVGKRLLEMLPRHRTLGLFDEYCQVVETGEPLMKESLIYEEVEGEERLVEAFDIRVTKLGDGCAVAWRDISDRKQAEEERRKSEERLRSYFTLPLVGIAVTSPEKGWLEVNDKLCEIFGYPRHELMQMTWIELTHPDDLAADLEQFNRVLAGESEGYSMEKRFIRKDGQVIHATISARCVRRADGSIDYFVALVQDITPRKQAQEKLHRREQELNALLENTPDVIIRIDKDFRYIYVNPQVERCTGMPAAAFIGKTSQDLGASPQLSQLWDKTLESVFATGQQQVIEYQAPAVNGLRTYQSRVVPELDDKGVTKYALVVARDITELKQAEAERTQLVCEQAGRVEAEAGRVRLDFLCKASEILASSLDYEMTLKCMAELAVPYMADWCFVDMVDDSGCIRRLAIAHLDPWKEELAWELSRRYPPNPNGSEGASKVIQTGISEVADPISDSALVAIHQDTETLGILHQLGLKSGLIVPLVANGRILGAVSFVTAESGRRYKPEDLILAEDLARRAALAVENARLYRKSQEANRMKDAFLSIVSHELRTPLNAVLGWTQLLRTRKFDETATVQALETIERNAKSQVKLIDDILEFSRMIGGRLRLNLRPVKLALVIYGAIDLVRPMAQGKGIELVPSLDSIAISVLGDRERLQQAVYHLLSNAVKFTPPGGRVEIKLEKFQIEECRLQIERKNYPFNLPSNISNLNLEPSAISIAQITVTDTGVGINAEFLPYVFDRFHQAESVKTRTQGGLGLGLAAVRQLVELHGGTVCAESQGEGLGARFTVQLPLLSEANHGH
jgi:PAS domain S-box-containing protein